jgi:hypothetical protein
MADQRRAQNWKRWGPYLSERRWGTLWNGKDPILEERLFGLTGPEGNHGEDVAEHYYCVDATPTHSYLRGRYQYPHPQRAFPYDGLVRRNRERGLREREYELADTGVFDDGRYRDIDVDYAKAATRKFSRPSLVAAAADRVG